MLQTVTHLFTGPVARSPFHATRPPATRGGAPGRTLAVVPSPDSARPADPGAGAGADPDADPHGDVHLETRRGRLVVRFEGEIDTAVRARFDRALLVVRAAHEPVEVDCRDVTFFCAEGVRMLMLLQSAAGGPGVTALRSCPWVDQALRLSGVECYPSMP